MRWHDAQKSYPKLGEPVLCEMANGKLIVAALMVEGNGKSGSFGMLWRATTEISGTDQALAVVCWARVGSPERMIAATA